MNQSIFGWVNSRKSIITLSATILCIVAVCLLFVPNSKSVLSAVLPGTTVPVVSTDTSEDLSSLTLDQIKELAQLNDKKISRIKQNKSVAPSAPSASSASIAPDTAAVSAASATQDGINLNNALAKYKIPASVQAKLDEINSKDIKWKANYNSIFVKSDAYKKSLLGLKPSAKINNFYCVHIWDSTFIPICFLIPQNETLPLCTL